jgi:sugar/nucleoside kinase (ribokinase family)
VGRNIAEKLGRLAAAAGDSSGSAFVVSLASVVAADAGGLGLVRALLDAGVDTDRVTILPESAQGAATATYTAIHGSDGDLVVSAGDFRVLEHFTEDSVLSLEHEGVIAEASVVVIDGNFSPLVFAALARAVHRAKKARAEKGKGDNNITSGPLLFFEPTSDHKCTLPIEAAENKNGGGLLNLVDITKPNISELVILLERAGQGSDPTVAAARGHLERGEEVPLDTATTLAQSLLGLLLLEGDIDNDKHVVVSLGGRGAVWASSPSSSSSSAVHVPLGEYAVSADDMQRLGLTTNGCGDAFCAALVLSAAQNGGVLSEDAIVRGYREAHRQITKKV